MVVPVVLVSVRSMETISRGPTLSASEPYFRAYVSRAYVRSQVLVKVCSFDLVLLSVDSVEIEISKLDPPTPGMVID